MCVSGACPRHAHARNAAKPCATPSRAGALPIVEMNVEEVTAKAKVLLEALPYIQDFRGATIVVKYGGSFMDDPDPEVRARVAYDIAFLAGGGINVVVVHGGGRAGFVRGLRGTDEATIAIVKKTLDEVVNRDVCQALEAAKARPKGLPGS